MKECMEEGYLLFPNSCWMSKSSAATSYWFSFAAEIISIGIGIGIRIRNRRVKDRLIDNGMIGSKRILNRQVICPSVVDGGDREVFIKEDEL